MSFEGETRLSRAPRSRALSVACALAVALAGCSTVQRAVSPGPAAATPDEGPWRGREHVRDALAHLNRGDAAAARRELMIVLRRQPGDGIARQLLQQIDTDPVVLLGRENYRYTLREGETLSTIAQRALGNPMMFYALARYNNILVPTSVVPGQVILVPGRRPAPPQPRPQQQAPRAAPAQPQPAPAAPPQAAAPTRNPRLAAQLRGQGLAAMNAGAIDRAVALLRRAVALDPGSALIRNDLNRALRIQRTVRTR